MVNNLSDLGFMAQIDYFSPEIHIFLFEAVCLSLSEDFVRWQGIAEYSHDKCDYRFCMEMSLCGCPLTFPLERNESTRPATLG